MKKSIILLVAVAVAVLAAWLMLPSPQLEPSAVESTAPNAARESTSVAPIDAAPAPDAQPGETDPVPIPSAVTTDDVGQVRVFGTVSDGRTGKPIAGALVGDAMEVELLASAANKVDAEAIKDSGLDFSAVKTDAEGRYELRFSRDFALSIRCSAEGYAFESEDLLEVQREEIQFDFALIPGATISGVVTERDTGAPLATASVSAETLKQMDEFEPFPVVAASTTTDDQGNFVLKDVPSGNVRVRVNAREKGFASVGNGVALTLRSEESVAGVELKVYPGGRVDGVVADAEGKPIEMAMVQLVNPDSAASIGVTEHLFDDESSMELTEVDGTFSIQGIDFDVEFALEASHENYQTVTSEKVILSQGAPSQTVRLSFAKGATISGVVRTKDGSPIQDGMLFLSPAEPASGRFSFSDRYLTVDDQGAFAFRNVPDGTYRISLSPMEGYFSQDDSANMLAVTVQNGTDVTGLEFVCSPDEMAITSDPRMAGQGTIMGVVLGVDGQPAAGVRVTVEPMSFSLELARTTTDANGSFSFSVTEIEPCRIKAISTAGEANAEDVAVGATIEVRLTPTTAVAGQVLDDSKKPVAGATIRLKRTAAEDSAASGVIVQSMADARNGEPTQTDSTGHFELLGVAAGEYRVQAIAPGHGVALSDAVSVRAGERRDSVSIQFAKSSVLSGVVRNREGSTIPGVEIQVYEAPASPVSMMLSDDFDVDAMSPIALANATSNADGAFMLPGLTPGEYMLRGNHGDYSAYVDTGVQIADSAPAQYTMVLSRGGMVRGVCLKAGSPAGGIQVMLVGVSGTLPAQSDADGRFAYENVTPGAYTLSAVDVAEMMAAEDETGMGSIAVRKVDVEEGKTTEVTLDEGATVTGSLAGGTEWDGGMVILRSLDSTELTMGDVMEVLSSGQTEHGLATLGYLHENGTFTLTDVEPGAYMLEIFLEPSDDTPDESEDITPEDLNVRPALSQRIVVAPGDQQIEVAMP